MKRFGKTWATIAALSGAAGTFAGQSAAQSAGVSAEAAATTTTEGSTTEGAVEGTPVEPVPADPPPTPEPPPPPPVEAIPPAAPVIRPYGLIKPTLVFAGRPVESFSQPNSSAVTAAGNPVLAALRDESDYTLQVAQSRLGFWFGEGQPVRGQLEFDFIDFGKSSPTVQALPRLRIAKVEWALSESMLLMAGQDWDLWGPVNPYTIDLVASNFQAGNTGFMRQQVKFIWHNDSLEVAGALGLPGINPAARAFLPEYNGFPSLAARFAVLMGAMGRIGAQFIGTQWRFSPGPTERKAFAGAAGLYADITPVERFNLRFEGYWGQNFANMGSLALGSGRGDSTAPVDMKEFGAFLSAKYGFTDVHAVYGTFGMAKISNDEDVVPSYTPATETTAAALAGTGAGMKQNISAHLGYEYRHNKSIALMLEGFLFQSEHVLDMLNADIDGNRTALGGQAGLLFTL